MADTVAREQPIPHGRTGYECLSRRVHDRRLHVSAITAPAAPARSGLGRSIPRIRRAAEQVDLDIVVATGCYTCADVLFFHHRGPGLNAALGTEAPAPMVDMFVRDINEGIAGTGVPITVHTTRVPGRA
jgi:predicted metal-dependent phosphotriesterase family hydrolase